MMYQYSYLIGSSFLLLVWVLFFVMRKDLRREMLILSLIMGFAGLIVQNIYFLDWWSPETITNTIPGIEDFIFGFSCAGIASGIYMVIIGKTLKTSFRKEKRNFIYNFFLLGFLLCLLFFGCFFVLKLNSFYSSIIAFSLPLLLIWVKRKDLIKNSLLSGIFLVLVSLFAFIIPEFFAPGWVESAWHFENLTGIVLFKAPLEDLLWFFLVGCFFGPLYEYWTDSKEKDLK